MKELKMLLVNIVEKELKKNIIKIKVVSIESKKEISVSLSKDKREDIENVNYINVRGSRYSKVSIKSYKVNIDKRSVDACDER